MAARQAEVPWTAAVTVGGQTAVELSRLTVAGAAVTLLRIDQRRARLVLHAGSSDPGGSDWRFGSSVTRGERHRLIAGLNGGFKLSAGAGGFLSHGKLAASLQPGAGSIVTYTSGYTDVGAWGTEVPRPGGRVEAVRQDLRPLVDGGRAASTVDCRSCWGATIGGATDVARSALGVDGTGRLVWAAGESLSPSALATALTGAGVVRAVELDINPQWVAGYLYRHRGRGRALVALPLVPGQTGIPGFYLVPSARDFFTILSR